MAYVEIVGYKIGRFQSEEHCGCKQGSHVCVRVRACVCVRGSARNLIKRCTPM